MTTPELNSKAVGAQGPTSFPDSKGQNAAGIAVIPGLSITICMGHEALITGTEVVVSGLVIDTAPPYGTCPDSNSNSGLVLGSTEYISDLEWGFVKTFKGDTVLGYLMIGTSHASSDGKITGGRRVSVGSPTSKGLFSAGKLSRIRLMSLAGSYGKYLNSLYLNYISDYEPSILVEANVSFIVSFTAANSKLTVYKESSSTKTDSFKQTTLNQVTQNASAGAKAEYFAEVSASTSIEYINSESTEISSQLTTLLSESSCTEIVIPESYVGILVAKANLMQTLSGSGETVYWMYPLSASYSNIPQSDIAAVNNFYDLGQLSIQMGGLDDYATTKNGYTYYTGIHAA